MKVINAALALCLVSASASAATDRPFKAATVESVLSACTDKTERQQGFCLGFVEALAVRLAENREFCAYWPVDMESIVTEAIGALSEADKNAAAWQVIEGRLTEKHLPPCK